jgi:hypothetical protein
MSPLSHNQVNMRTRKAERRAGLLNPAHYLMLILPGTAPTNGLLGGAKPPSTGSVSTGDGSSRSY